MCGCEKWEIAVTLSQRVGLECRLFVNDFDIIVIAVVTVGVKCVTV